MLGITCAGSHDVAVVAGTVIEASPRPSVSKLFITFWQQDAKLDSFIGETAHWLYKNSSPILMTIGIGKL